MSFYELCKTWLHNNIFDFHRENGLSLGEPVVELRSMDLCCENRRVYVRIGHHDVLCLVSLWRFSVDTSCII